MELVFTLLIVLFIMMSVGWLTDRKWITGGISTVFLVGTIVYLVMWLNSERVVDIIIPTTITTSDGIEVMGYFKDDTTIKIVPNHIVEVHITHPRWGSLDPETYEYKFTNTNKN